MGAHPLLLPSGKLSSPSSFFLMGPQARTLAGHSVKKVGPTREMVSSDESLSCPWKIPAEICFRWVWATMVLGYHGFGLLLGLGHCWVEAAVKGSLGGTLTHCLKPHVEASIRIGVLPYWTTIEESHRGRSQAAFSCAP